MNAPIEIQLQMNADPGTIWKLLTEPELMKQWMGEPEMKLEINTTWKIGSPISIKGFHHINFENKGVVLKYEENTVLSYNHLDSVSGLNDRPENYSIIEFNLLPVQNQTILKIKLDNFPTETIFKHLQFYWTNTIGLIRKMAEQKIDA